MHREEFDELVAQAIEALPAEFRSRLENVAVVVQDWPTAQQLHRAGLKRPTELLGLYEGIPHTERGTNYNLVLPDRITIFSRPIEARCRSRNELMARIGEVVRHEIAHHFGLSEKALREIEDAE